MYKLILLFIPLLALAFGARAMEPIQHWTTSTGVEVHFVPADALPMVDLRLVFNAGSARDGDTPGLARMTSRMLDQGAGQWDADAIAAELEARGARLSTGAKRDMAWVSLRSLRDPAQLQPALEIYKAVVTRPSFAQRAFERERKRALVGLQFAQQKPGTVASNAFYAAVYDDHPYATPSDGTVEGLEALSPADLKDFHDNYYVGRNAVLAIVGDLDRPEAERLAEQVTADMQPGEAAAKLPRVDGLDAAQTKRIDHPSSQTHILMGQPGMRRGDPDYFPLYVGNYVLGGGGLVSRISEEVREKRGLSYSAYSYFLPMQRKGPLVLGLQTRTDQAGEALQVLRETLRQFVENGPTDDELDAAIKHITGAYPLRIDSNGEILEYIAMIGFYDLPLDYLERFNDRVRAVSRDDIRDAFQRRVDPDALVTVIVGTGAAE